MQSEAVKIEDQVSDIPDHAEFFFIPDVLFLLMQSIFGCCS